jgi:hypothetical protein
VVVVNVAVFWEIAPCSLYVNRCFGGTYHVYLNGRKSAEQETGLATCRTLVSRSTDFEPLRWR